MRKNTLFAIMLPMLLLAVMTTAFPLELHADTARQRLDRVATDATAGAGYSAADEGTLAQKIGLIIKAFLSLIGIIFLGLLIHGGYQWMTASGNEEEIKKAKTEISAAVIGLIIVVAAFSIAEFVLVELLTRAK